MTKVISTLALTAFLLTSAGVAFAASTGAVDVTADVSGALTLEAHMFKDSPAGPTGAEIPLGTGMIFGNLKEVTFAGTGADAGKTFKELRSDDTAPGGGVGGFVVLLTANSHGLGYSITQTSSGPLTAGSNTIPTGACRINMFYATQDNGGAADTGTPGPTASWAVGINPVYTNSSDMRTIQAHLAISGKDPGGHGDEVVPINQPTGHYIGTVTFTTTAV